MAIGQEERLGINHTFVLTEDDVLAVLRVKRALKTAFGEEVRVVVAGTASKAIEETETAEARGETITHLLDYHFPKDSGRAVLDYVRAREGRGYVVFTGDWREKHYPLADAVMQKGTDPRGLRDVYDPIELGKTVRNLPGHPLATIARLGVERVTSLYRQK